MKSPGAEWQRLYIVPGIDSRRVRLPTGSSTTSSPSYWFAFLLVRLPLVHPTASSITHYIK